MTPQSSWPRATPRSSLEMQRILAEHVPGIEVVGLDDVDGYDEPVEDQPTFEGNALLKARAGVAATGLPSLADDSGLCVDALNGMPGVLSARWSGPPKSDDAATTSCCSPSSATYPTSAAAPTSPARWRGAAPTAASWSSRAGWTAGSSARSRGSGGFGYDVLFVADEHAERAHHRRARAGREGRRSPTGAGRCASSLRRSPAIWPQPAEPGRSLR